MFILRRKTDGLYYRNADAHQAWRLRADNWTENIQLCKPFRTRQAVMNSRGPSGIGLPFEKPANHTDTAEWRAYYQRIAQWNSKQNRKERYAWQNRRFDELYEIVPVKIVVEES